MPTHSVGLSGRAAGAAAAAKGAAGAGPLTDCKLGRRSARLRAPQEHNPTPPELPVCARGASLHPQLAPASNTPPPPPFPRPFRHMNAERGDGWAGSTTHRQPRCVGTWPPPNPEDEYLGRHPGRQPDRLGANGANTGDLVTGPSWTAGYAISELPSDFLQIDRLPSRWHLTGHSARTVQGTSRGSIQWVLSTLNSVG